MELGGIDLLNLGMMFAAGFGGVAVGWGALKNQVATNKNDIEEFSEEWKTFQGLPGGEPVFMSRNELNERHGKLTKDISHIREKVDNNGKATKGLQNFARYQLNKEGLTLIEINKIINGGGK